MERKKYLRIDFRRKIERRFKRIMAEFRGVLSGNRGDVSRLGSKNSGISAHIRSWKNDVYATLIKDDDGKDVLNLNIPNDLRVNLNNKLLIVKDGVLIDDSLKKDE